MRPFWLVLSTAFLLANTCEAHEKPLFVVHSNYRANKTAQWKRNINGGSTIWAVTSDGKQVTVTKQNLEEVVADLATQEEEPKALMEDLKGLGHEVMSKQEYDPQKHTGPMVAVTVNNVVGAVPGMGYVFFGKDFVSQEDLRDGDKVARASKILWSDARVAVGGKMTRQFDGPGTPVFRAELEGLLREAVLGVDGGKVERQAEVNDKQISNTKQAERERDFVDWSEWPALMAHGAEWREENGRFRVTVGDGRHMTVTYADGRTGRCNATIKGVVIHFGGDVNGYGGIGVEDGKLVMQLTRYSKEGELESRVRLVSTQMPPEPRTDGT